MLRRSWYVLLSIHWLIITPGGRQSATLRQVPHFPSTGWWWRLNFQPRPQNISRWLEATSCSQIPRFSYIFQPYWTPFRAFYHLSRLDDRRYYLHLSPPRRPCYPSHRRQHSSARAVEYHATPKWLVRHPVWIKGSNSKAWLGFYDRQCICTECPSTPSPKRQPSPYHILGICQPHVHIAILWRTWPSLLLLFLDTPEYHDENCEPEIEYFTRRGYFELLFIVQEVTASTWDASRLNHQWNGLHSRDWRNATTSAPAWALTMTKSTWFRRIQRHAWSAHALLLEGHLRQRGMSWFGCKRFSSTCCHSSPNYKQYPTTSSMRNKGLPLRRTLSKPLLHTAPMGTWRSSKRDAIFDGWQLQYQASAANMVSRQRYIS